MFVIQTRNAISEAGLDLFDRNQYTLTDNAEKPDGILVRSAVIKEDDIQSSVKAIVRVGAGVNTIPVDYCSLKGIVVFNTPGANANSVKELVIAGLLLSSRGICEGINWLNGLTSDNRLSKLVEKEKSRFAGTEIEGKTLGVIGLGAIGVLVANAATKLGMTVYGHDPFISVSAAWGLSGKVIRSENLEQIMRVSDYVSIHAPLTANTQGLLNTRLLQQAKPGLRILNFARDGLVDWTALREALQSGRIDRYITDFPTPEIVGQKGVMCIPHLGASTKEAEDNCAVMAVRQIINFLECGTIENSVNFPSCFLESGTGCRILVANRNVPNMLSQILDILAKEGLNVDEMVNKNHGDIAYNIIDISPPCIDSSALARLNAIDGVIMTRHLPAR